LADEKLEIERKIRRLQDEEAVQIRRSQELASRLYAEKRNKDQGFTFIQILLALLGGILVGFMLAPSSS
jgi:F0F1-type ATP synthase assembly protein I